MNSLASKWHIKHLCHILNLIRLNLNIQSCLVSSGTLRKKHIHINTPEVEVHLGYAYVIFIPLLVFIIVTMILYRSNSFHYIVASTWLIEYPYCSILVFKNIEPTRFLDDSTQLMYTDHTWSRIVIYSPWYQWDLVAAQICSLAARLKSPSLAGTGEASHLICILGASSSQTHDMSLQSAAWIAKYGTPVCHNVIIAWSTSVNFHGQIKDYWLIHSRASPLSIWLG